MGVVVGLEEWTFCHSATFPNTHRCVDWKEHQILWQQWDEHNKLVNCIHPMFWNWSGKENIQSPESIFPLIQTTIKTRGRPVGLSFLFNTLKWQREDLATLHLQKKIYKWKSLLIDRQHLSTSPTTLLLIYAMTNRKMGSCEIRPRQWLMIIRQRIPSRSSQPWQWPLRFLQPCRMIVRRGRRTYRPKLPVKQER